MTFNPLRQQVGFKKKQVSFPNKTKQNKTYIHWVLSIQQRSMYNKHTHAYSRTHTQYIYIYNNQAGEWSILYHGRVLHLFSVQIKILAHTHNIYIYIIIRLASGPY